MISSLVSIRAMAGRCLVPLLTLSLFAPLARGDVELPSIFSNHMVLQKSEHVPFWGKAAPGERVQVTLEGKTAAAEADATGHWKLELNLKDSAPGPFEITVEGKNRLVIHDAVVGEVWVASGQSNMELPLKVTTGAEAEIAKSANPLLRQFSVRRGGGTQPAENCEGQWTIASPETSGSFTAIGYYFGKDLNREMKVPVGIVHISNGGTYIESWMPAEAFKQDEALEASADAKRKTGAEFPAEKAKFVKDFTAWLREHARVDQPCPNPDLYAAENASTADWATVDLPGKVTEKGFPSSGVFWIRRNLDVSELLAKQGFKIMIGPLEGDWQVYWDGKKLTEMTYQQMPGKGFTCYFPVPPEQIRAGKNTLAIRIFSPKSPLVVAANPANFWAGPLNITGKWFAKVERAFPDLSPDVIASAPQLPPQPPTVPSILFNGRINPVIPYALAGVLWYQGENNVTRAVQYGTAFPLLIKTWREKWKRDDLPFYFCQLSNNNAKGAKPGESAWAELRESQTLALGLPHTGQAVMIDLGEAGDFHFRDKKTVGDRLYLIAKAKHYGQNAVCSGPVYESAAIKGGKARINFGNTDGGLVAGALPPTYNVKTLTGETLPLIRNSPKSELEGFAVCGEDHKWVWADAKIEGPSVVVWSDKVPNPVAVRYAWADNPTCNLYNGAGLPASPFRTDHFPETTAKAHY